MKSIAKALMSGNPADIDKAVAQEALLFAVQRTLQDKYTGAVLDVRTAVLYTVEVDGKRAAECIAGTTWDRIKEIVEAKLAELNGSLEVIDGRQ